MTEAEIYAKCLTLGMTPAGAAGCTANIMAESAGRPNNVEDRSGIPDEVYTRNVDNHTYNNFAGDAYGFGLAQWTSRQRKEALLSYAQGKGVSIADADMQFQFLGREMRQSYAYIWNVLTSTDDPYAAGYEMCKKYEIPADTERQAQYRGNQAHQIYQRCSGMPPVVNPVEPSEPKGESFWPPRTICKGMNGRDVSALQALLAAHGYAVPSINGVFEYTLDQLVRQYQKDNGLAVDGIVGNNTWTSLLRR